MELTQEKLQRKYTKATDALTTLEEAIIDLQKVPTLAKCGNYDENRVYRTYRDSLIQRFEYTFDTTWKYLSDFLQQQGRILPIKTPKAIFREALKATFLSEPDVRLALKMVDHRNVTTHGYNEALIEEISENIPQYTQLIKKILQKSCSLI